MRIPSRPIAVLLALLILVAPAVATWSVVVVNKRTGEVCVASATCLTGFNLKVWTPVLIPEIGAAAAQSFVDSTGANRILIHDQFLAGTDPDQILVLLAQADASHQTRQYGLVDLAGRAATFSGTGAGAWAGGVTGQAGDLVYAIQGNVLTCPSVVDDAEFALLNTPGDLGQKVMAAMEAAAAQGGDGRCSCDPFDADGCGCVTTWPADRSAYVAYFLLARPGDGDGPCEPSRGCAQGDYYLDINLPNRGVNGPEPIVELRQRYDAWRVGQAGRPDAMLSEVRASAVRVPAGSGEVIILDVDLADIDGVPLSSGGATITLVHEPGSSGQASLLQVTDNNDGTYRVEVASGAEPGVDRIRLVVDDGIRPVTLWPSTNLVYAAAPQLPYNRDAPIYGLNTSRSDSQPFPLPDGLTAYVLSDRQANHMRLMRATRPSTSVPFQQAVEVPGMDIPGLQVFDFWISADELRLTFCGYAPGSSIEQLFRTQRAMAGDRFDPPVLITELNSDLNDGGPWLSPDELTLYFHSARDGTFDLWRAERLDLLSAWFPPVKLTGASSGDEEMFPMLAGGGTRLFYGRSPSGGELGLFYAEMDALGEFQSAGSIPGSMHRLNTSELPSSLPDGQLWYTTQSGSDSNVRFALETSDALTASGVLISASAGGRVDLTLDAGQDFAGARYALVAGGSGATPGAAFEHAVLPLAEDGASLLSLGMRSQFVNFQGTLTFAGRGFAALDLAAGTPVKPVFLDRDYLFAYLAFGVEQEILVSNSVQVRLVP